MEVIWGLKGDAYMAFLLTMCLRFESDPSVSHQQGQELAEMLGQVLEKDGMAKQNQCLKELMNIYQAAPSHTIFLENGMDYLKNIISNIE